MVEETKLFLNSCNNSDEADVMKKLCQRHLTALKLGLQTFIQNALKVEYTVMCVTIKYHCFAEVFHHICLVSDYDYGSNR
jgi:hypothetical protein